MRNKEEKRSSSHQATLSAICLEGLEVAGKLLCCCVRVLDVQYGSCQDYLHDRSSHANPLEPNTGSLSRSCLIATQAYLKSQEQFARICVHVFEYLPWDRSKEEGETRKFPE